MRKKIKYIGIFILIVAIISGGIIFFCKASIIAYFVPTVEQLGDIHIEIKNDTSYVNSKLIIKNKSFLKIEIDTIKYKVCLFGKAYLENKKSLGILLRGHGKDTIDFSLKIPYMSIVKDLKSERRKGDSASYSINVSLQYSTFLGRSEIPINKSAKLKIPQPPDLEIVEVKFKKIRLRSIQAVAKIKIVNYGPVKLTIRDMRYSMKILKAGSLKGTCSKPINIKAKGTTFVELPLDINVTNMGKTIFQIVMNKDKYNYELTLHTMLESIDPVKESLHVDLTKNGKMELKK